MTEKTYYETLPWFSIGSFQIGAKVAENVGICTSENGVHLSKDKCVANPIPEKDLIRCDPKNGVRTQQGLDGELTCVIDNIIGNCSEGYSHNSNGICIPDCDPGEYYSVNDMCISKTQDAICCKAMTPNCLACSEGYGDDVASYCKKNPDMCHSITSVTKLRR
jgi:hypothetical protein